EELVRVTAWGRGIDTIGIDLSASQRTVGYLDFEYRPLLRTGEILETIPGVIATQHFGVALPKDVPASILDACLYFTNLVYAG
ncbi:MAG: hypothetical protein KAZ58_03095, partial [Arenimonas sp.]|nr:hypothetical protein [Arenimonas sp.]